MIDLFVVARTAHFVGAALVLGPLVFGIFIAAPAREPLTRRATSELATVWCGLALAVVSGMIWLIVIAARMADFAIADWSVVQTVLTQTQFGHVWIIRGVVACSLALALFFSWPGLGQVLCDIIRLVLAGVFVGTLAFAGHSGATEGLLGNVHAAGDAMHVIAAATWIGALAPLCASCLAAGSEAGDVPALHTVARRFSILGIVCVAMLVSTGLINAWMLLGSPRDLITTGYGRILLAKLVLFAMMLGFAALNRQVLVPRLAVNQDAPPKTAQWLATSCLLELAVGAAIFALVGVLGSLPPPLHGPSHVHEQQ